MRNRKLNGDDIQDGGLHGNRNDGAVALAVGEERNRVHPTTRQPARINFHEVVELSAGGRKHQRLAPSPKIQTPEGNYRW